MNAAKLKKLIPLFMVRLLIKIRQYYFHIKPFNHKKAKECELRSSINL